MADFLIAVAVMTVILNGVLNWESKPNLTPFIKLLLSGILSQQHKK